MIYTGYFAKLKVYEEAGLQPVSIAGRAPAFFKGPQYKGLAPRFKMFNDWKKGKITDMDYFNIFSDYLNTLDKESVKRVLNSFGKDVVLLCYEKPGDFCHRHIVADWIENNLGMRVDEYDIDQVKRWNTLIESLKDRQLTESEIHEMYRAESVEKVVSILEDYPPEGYFLYRMNGEDETYYSLENKEEWLRSFGIGEG